MMKTTDPLAWVAGPLFVRGEPRNWGAGAHPWTLTITFDGARYAVAADDSRSPFAARLGLGTFETLDAARQACVAFLDRQQHLAA